MEYIRGLERYEMDSFRDKVNSGLNRWASGQDEMAPEWTLDVLASELPEAIKSESFFKDLGKDNFYANDADYVQEIYWLREIANRMADSNFVFHQEYIFQTGRRMADAQTLESWEQESDVDLLLEALKLIHPELVEGDDDSQIRDLARGVKLLDWTIRNFLLLEARPWPTTEIILMDSVDRQANPDEFLPDT